MLSFSLNFLIFFLIGMFWCENKICSLQLGIIIFLVTHQPFEFCCCVLKETQSADCFSSGEFSVPMGCNGKNIVERSKKDRLD